MHDLQLCSTSRGSHPVLGDQVEKAFVRTCIFTAYGWPRSHCQDIDTMVQVAPSLTLTLEALGPSGAHLSTETKVCRAVARCVSSVFDGRVQLRAKDAAFSSPNAQHALGNVQG